MNPEHRGRSRWLSRDEAAALLSAARKSSARAHLPAFILLCLHSGLRPGEALALEWARVDFGRGRLILEADDSKNGKAAEVPISPSARVALIERARFRAQWCPGSPWVFCRRNGERIAQIKHGFASAAAAAGLSG